MEEVAQMKQDILKLKAISNTVADSATAYQITAVLGASPTSDNTMYLWHIYVTPLKNDENAVFTAEPVGGYMFQKSGSIRYPFVNSIYPLVDINNTRHFMVPLFPYNPEYVEKYGDNAITITSTVPFQILSTNRESIQIY